MVQYRTCFSATERSDEPAPGNLGETNPVNKNQNKKKDDNGDSDERLRDLPKWLKDFADNLEDTEMPVPEHISRDSDSEHPTRVHSVITSRKSETANHACGPR